MVIEDSPGLTVGPDLFLNADYVKFGDHDNDTYLSPNFEARDIP